MFINDVFTIIIQIIVIPLLIILSTFLINLIKTKINNLQKTTEDKTLSNYLILLDEAVDTAVAYINQTYVNQLKADNTFDEKAQQEALSKAYQRVVKTLTYEATDYLQTHIGEFSNYIFAKIEASIYNNKKGQEN